jgi:hypothetical protein
MMSDSKTCDHCEKRPGKLVAQYSPGPGMVFRGYLCRWCLGIENRERRKYGQRRLGYVDWKPDDQVMAEEKR